MTELFITNQIDFDVYCQELVVQKRIAIDTEFMRVRTLNPQFALLQIACRDSLAIIDPLTITNWSAFIAILTNPDIEKIFHAGGEDLVLFWHSLKCTPTPYIDTQVLGAFIEDGASLGLANALSHHLELKIDKSETRTDWLLRPLSPKQIDYAYDDVRYLLALYEALLSKLSPELLSYATAECQHLAHKTTIAKDGMTLYQNFPLVDKLNRQQLGLLQILANWRYHEAVKKDLALNFIVHEKNLVSIAQYQPKAMFELQKLGLHSNEIRIHGEILLKLVTEYQLSTPSLLPNLVPSLHANPRYKTDFANIKFALEQIATQVGISGQLIASRKQINQLLSAFYLLNDDHDLTEKNMQPLPSDTLIDLLLNWRQSLCLSPLQKLGFVE